MTWGQGGYVSPEVKRTVRRRDKTCRLQYPGCTQGIEEMHHPIGLADQGKQRTAVTKASDVVGVCRWCHGIETRAQQARGRERARAQRGSLSRRYRDSEAHPGAL